MAEAVNDEKVDKSWLLDMVVQSMQSQTWNGPLNDFIREKCIIFDNFQDENKHEYVTIHNEFKNLIDDLLTAHLLDVDILPEDFERECLDAGLANDPRMQKVISQLLAAEDFVTFKGMMIDAHASQQMEAENAFKDASQVDDEATLRAIMEAQNQEVEMMELAAARRIAQEADAADAAALAAATAASLEERASASPAVPAAYAAPVARPSPLPDKAPTAEEERAFGAGGGFYGRGQIGGHKKTAANEKSAAIKKALLSGGR